MDRATTYANTVIAIFPNNESAQHATQELVRNGLNRDQIEITTADAAQDAASGNTGLSGRTQDTSGGGISGFFHRLFGGDASEEDRRYYSHATRPGRCALIVHASDDVVDNVASVLNDNGAIDVDTEADTRSTSDVTSRSDTRAGARRTGDESAIPVVNEELRVGKRTVQRGGVRVYSHVTERPAEESVSLREEHVRVERRPANRPATEADIAAANRGAIEINETVEEPVVEKQARVVEEVIINKDVTQRTENVRDTVRRSDVEVTNTGKGSDDRMRGDDTEFRSYVRSTYGDTARYEDYEPAYRYGSEMAQDPRYRGRNFSEVESDLRTEYSGEIRILPGNG